MVELPGRRIVSANDGGFAPPPEEKPEEEVVQAAPVTPEPEPASRPTGVAESAAPIAPEEEPSVAVEPSTEIPPLPTRDWTPILRQADPEAARFHEARRLNEGNKEAIENAPAPLKTVLSDERDKRIKDLLEATGPEIVTKANDGETNAVGYLDRKKEEEQGQSLATETLQYINKFLGAIPTPYDVASEAMKAAGLDQMGSEYTKGLLGGAQSTEAMTYGGFAQYLSDLGFKDAPDFLDKWAKQAHARSKGTSWEPLQPLFPDWRKEEPVRNFANYIAYKAGEGMGNIASIIAMRTMTGKAVGSGFLYTLSVGEMRGNLMEAGIKDPAKLQAYVYPTAAAIAFLDSRFPEGIARRMTGQTRTLVVKGLTKAFVRGAVKGGVQEGITEMMQEILAIASTAHAKGAETIFDTAPIIEEFSKTGTWGRVGEAGVGGALGGAQISGGVGVVENAQRQQQLAAKGRTLGFDRQEAAPAAPAEPAAPTGPEIQPEPPAPAEPTGPEIGQEQAAAPDGTPELVTEDPAVLEAQRELAQLGLDVEQGLDDQPPTAREPAPAATPPIPEAPQVTPPPLPTEQPAEALPETDTTPIVPPAAAEPAPIPPGEALGSAFAEYGIDADAIASARLDAGYRDREMVAAAVADEEVIIRGVDETGAEINIAMPAGEALREADNRLSGLDALLQCMRMG